MNYECANWIIEWFGSNPCKQGFFGLSDKGYSPVIGIGLYSLMNNFTCMTW